MSGKLQTIDRRLLARQCVACGYDGALLRGGQASHCARCGCNLGERPARSYAEMEGLIGRPFAPQASNTIPVREERLIHRWITFIFVLMLFVIVMGYLGMTAMAMT